MKMKTTYQNLFGWPKLALRGNLEIRVPTFKNSETFQTKKLALEIEEIPHK